MLDAFIMLGERYFLHFFGELMMECSMEPTPPAPPMISALGSSLLQIPHHHRQQSKDGHRGAEPPGGAVARF